MDSASSLAYPGSRILAGWWRQLQGCEPAALWVGHLFIHRVEALVESVEPRPVDPISLHVLQVLAVPHARLAPELLAQQLHLPLPATQQLLFGLQGQQLVRQAESDHWQLSERGRTVLQARADLTPRRERRVFPFVERLGPTGRRLATPRFIPLRECTALRWEPDDAHRFEPHWLAEPALPTGVRIITTAENEANGVWERVIVDRPLRLAVAFARTKQQELLAYAAEPDGWKLHSDQPILQGSEAARDLLADTTLPAAAWEEAWRLWCRQRHLPRGEAEACRLSFDGIHLDVQAPDAFVQRLQAANSELIRDDAGILAGDAYVRPLALLRLTAAR